MRIEACHHQAILRHLRLLGHPGFGVTELRIFRPQSQAAYADSGQAVVKLASEAPENALGIYIGIQPRPLELFDKAPNRWMPALKKPDSNCACDADIEYITAFYFDIDVISDPRRKGHPASDKELQESREAADCFMRENSLAKTATLACSGNGCSIIIPIVPLPIDSGDIADKLRELCHQMAMCIQDRFAGVKVDPVYNLSRVMRLMGTLNCKGSPLPDRPHRRAHFLTEPLFKQSMELHFRLKNIEIQTEASEHTFSHDTTLCDNHKIEDCEFIRWCRNFPLDVTEPLWFAMVTNLSRLSNGETLAHEISQLDLFRYDYQETQRLIERVQHKGYSPTTCKTIGSYGFKCPRYGVCRVHAPMYITRLFSI